MKRTFVVILGLLGVTAVPPLLLQVTASVLPLDWSLMSSVGQSYTGVSALFTAVAVLAAVYTLNTGQKQGAEAERFHTRQMQFQLQLLRLQDRDLAGVTDVESDDLNAHRERKRIIYANMWMNHFYYSYVSGVLTGAGVQAALRGELAATASGHSYWEQTGAAWAALQPDFAGYVAEEFARAALRREDLSEDLSEDGVDSEALGPPERVVPD